MDRKTNTFKIKKIGNILITLKVKTLKDNFSIYNKMEYIIRPYVEAVKQCFGHFKDSCKARSTCSVCDGEVQGECTRRSDMSIVVKDISRLIKEFLSGISTK